MVGIPRISISVSRTYLAAIYDVVCPNETRLEKFVLPDSFSNNAAQALYYYRSKQRDMAIRIIDVFPYEQYMAACEDILDDAIFPSKSKLVPLEKAIPNFHEKDMEQVCQMLDAWNDEQKEPALGNYANIVRKLLQENYKQSVTISKINSILGGVK